MPNNYFEFKQFTIHHDKCGMKVGTDGVLLGAWANIENAEKILDVGTGTGLIAIMLAQRATNAMIEAVEVESNAFEQAKINISFCPWKNRINIHNTSFQTYCSNTKVQFDLIICNPPYFKNSLKANEKKRNIARHSDILSNIDLLHGSSKILSSFGRFAVIMPYSEGCTLIVEATRNGLFCIRKTNVKTKPAAPVKRLLLEFSRIPGFCSDDNLIIGKDDAKNYSVKYKQLTKDFYLAF